MREWTDLLSRTMMDRLGVDAVAVTVRAGALQQDVVAATDGWARWLEDVQYTVGEGPGVEAFTGGRAVLVPDVRASTPQWPGFVSEAVGARLGAVFAFPVGPESTPLGTIDLYRREPGELAIDQARLAVYLTDVVGTALLAGWWPPGEDRYSDVNVAAGMLAGWLNVPVDEALLRLRVYAFGRGRSVLDVAADVVARRLPRDVFD
jgi:hypothetical protein